MASRQGADAPSRRFRRSSLASARGAAASGAASEQPLSSQTRDLAYASGRAALRFLEPCAQVRECGKDTSLAGVLPSIGRGSMVLPTKDLAMPRYQAGDIIADKYRLDRLLGQGGMGAVWAAFNLQLEAPVAIKVLPWNERDHEHADLVQRLKQEAKLAAKLVHPAIVRVFDVGESSYGDPFIVMELLEGQSLSGLLRKEVCLSPVRAVQLLLPIADALVLAHSKDIIHCDLKPDNVFICDGDEVQPKLVDFGIVKVAGPAAAQSQITQFGTVLGSPAYMSPEQARGRDNLDPRTDVWSFCVMLYEVIVGVPPFSGPSYSALIFSIAQEEPRPFMPRSESETELWRLIQRGLRKDRGERFASMQELGRALAAWLVQQGVFEDVCGVGVEVKWGLRSSGPALPPAARARSAAELDLCASAPAAAMGSQPAQSELSSAPPLSGLALAPPRAELASAPTLHAVAARVGSSLPSESLVVPKRGRASVWVWVSLAAAFAGGFGWVWHAAESAPQAAGQPVSSRVRAVTTSVLPANSLPPAAPASVAEPRPSAAAPAAAASVSGLVSAGSPSAAAPAAARRPSAVSRGSAKPAASNPARVPPPRPAPEPSLDRPAGELLSPY